MNDIAEDTGRRKRQRAIKPDVNDILQSARQIWGRDGKPPQATMTEDRSFREYFGCSALVALSLWSMLVTVDLLPPGGTIEHLLWTLLFLKLYPLGGPLTKFCNGADKKTIKKYVWGDYDTAGFIPAIASLESFVIIWANRFKGDKGNDCLVSVDGTDFRIPNKGPAFSSHKYKMKSALRYEVALCILTGDIVWINGPYEAGLWNDWSIFQNSLLTFLEPNERVEADDGYIGGAPQSVKCPKSLTTDEEKEYMVQRVRNRQETVNKRFKQWNILKTHDYRHDITDHGDVSRAIVVVTQLAINSGERLFDTYYDDNPPWMNNNLDN